MAEQFRSITHARKEFPALTQLVQDEGDRYVITNHGEPQAVLLGYEEYKGLLASVALMGQSQDLQNLKEGLAQTRKISADDLMSNLRRRKEAKDTTAPAAKSITLQPLHDAVVLQQDIESLDELVKKIRAQVVPNRPYARQGEIVVTLGEELAAAKPAGKTSAPHANVKWKVNKKRVFASAARSAGMKAGKS